MASAVTASAAYGSTAEQVEQVCRKSIDELTAIDVLLDDTEALLKRATAERGARVVRQTHECFAVARVRHGELCAVLRRPPNFDKLRSGAQGGDLFDPAARERAKRVASGKEGTRLRKTWKSLQADCDKLGGRIRKLSTAINEALPTHNSKASSARLATHSHADAVGSAHALQTTTQSRSHGTPSLLHVDSPHQLTNQALSHAERATAHVLALERERDATELATDMRETKNMMQTMSMLTAAHEESIERVVASTDAALKRTQQATKHVEDAAASQKQSSCAIM